MKNLSHRPGLLERNHSSRHISGQGLTEYLIIVAIIAIACVGAASFFGDSVKANFLSLGSDLTGGEVVDRVAETSTSRAKAETDTNSQTTLRNYNN
jgi:Flp pilus assembly pilin Flp